MTGLRVTPVAAGRRPRCCSGAVDPATAFGLLDLQPQQGSPEALTAPGTIAVYDETAREKGLSIGSTVPVVFKDTGPQELTVAMIYGEELEANGPVGTYFVGTATYEANVAEQRRLEGPRQEGPGRHPRRGARRGGRRRSPPTRASTAMDKAEFAESVYAPLDPMMALVYALLGLAIVIALLGIGNTLALSIVERTREIGLLRAVGMTRSQLRGTIRWESVIIAIQGTAASGWCSGCSSAGRS